MKFTRNEMETSLSTLNLKDTYTSVIQTRKDRKNVIITPETFLMLFPKKHFLDFFPNIDFMEKNIHVHDRILPFNVFLEVCP